MKKLTSKEHLRREKAWEEKYGLLSFSKEPLNLKELLNFYFIKQYPTYIDIGLYCCGKGRNRSIRDLYLVGKTYFPKLSLEKLWEYIRYQQKDIEKWNPVWGCPDIGQTIIDCTDKGFKNKLINNLENENMLYK